MLPTATHTEGPAVEATLAAAGLDVLRKSYRRADLAERARAALDRAPKA